MKALRATILIADDHAPMRRLMRRVCASDSRNFIEAASGEEAVAAYEREHPDLVLMDIEMPGLDGLAATRAIRAAHPAARIIIITHHDLPAFRREAAEAGATGFVSKEDLSQLTALVSIHSLTQP